MVTKHHQLLYNLSFSYLSFNLLLWYHFSIFLLCYNMLACFSALIFVLLFTIYDIHLIFRCIWQPKCDRSIVRKYSRRFQSKTMFRYGILYKLRVLTFTEQNNNEHYIIKLHYQLLYNLSFSYLAFNLLLWRSFWFIFLLSFIADSTTTVHVDSNQRQSLGIIFYKSVEC